MKINYSNPKKFAMGLAIGNAIGIPFGGASQSWESYWANQTEVLFFGLYSEISGGQMPNKKTGSSDYLTVAGAAGSETYQCPNTASYIDADTDYIWFDPNGDRRTVSTTELIGYDLQRTPVMYDDASPNALRAIIILNSAVVGAKRDRMFKDLMLHTLWDNNLNSNGHIKDNRVTQNLWIESDVMVYMQDLTAPLSRTEVTDLNTLVKDLQGLNIVRLSEAFDAWWHFAGETSEVSLRNLVSRNYDAELTGAPTWTKYEGFTGGTGKSVTAPFPLRQGVSYQLDSASVGVYMRVGIATTGQVVHAADGTNFVSVNDPTGTRANRVYVNDSGYADIAITSGVGMTIKSRLSYFSVTNFCNKNYGYNSNTPSNEIPNNTTILLVPALAVQNSVVFIGRGFTQAEMGLIQDAVEKYMDSKGKGVIV